MITVTVTGTKPEQMIEIVEGVIENCKKGISEVAQDSRNTMVGYVQAGYMGRGKRDGSKGDLENSIQAEQIDNDSWGVGNIKNLNHDAPYWGLLNAGGMVAIKARRVPGYFGDGRPPMAGYAGTGVGKEQFTYTPRGQKDYAGPGVFGGKQFLMVVQNPIGAVNYIEKTKDWLSTVMKVQFAQWTKSQSYAKK